MPKLNLKSLLGSLEEQFNDGKLNTAITGASTLAGGLMSDGFSTGAGSLMQGLSGVASAIPGPIGAIAGAGLNVVGGLANRAFGVKANQAELNRVNNDTNILNQTADAAAGATSFDDNALQGTTAINTNVNAYKGGWFSGDKAARKNTALQQQLLDAQGFANRAIDNSIDNIANNQMGNLLANSFAFGGDTSSNGSSFNNGLTFFNEGGTHEQNPLGGIPQGIAEDGLPNLVEEGEVKFGDYIFSNRLKVDGKNKKKYKLKDNMTYADAVKKLSKITEERPNDPIAKATLDKQLDDLTAGQEEKRMKKEQNQYKCGGKMHKCGGHIHADGKKLNLQAMQGIPSFMGESVYTIPKYTVNKEPLDIDQEKMKAWDKQVRKNVNDAYYSDKNLEPTWMRYAPIVGSALGFGLSMLPADYSNADAVANSSRGNSGYDRVSFKPIGDYLTYRPDDFNYLANQLRASEQAANNAIANTSGGNAGNAMAGIIANNYRSQLAQGEAYRAAQAANRAQQMQVADFNRGTNLQNSQGFLQADTANQNARARANASLAESNYRSAAMRQAIADQRNAGISASLTNLFDNLGALGSENFAFNQANTNEALRYNADKTGASTYKKKKKCGGYLKTRKK